MSSEQVEQRARAVCAMCESGTVPATLCGEHGWEHIYPPDEDGYVAAELCHAADIRALSSDKE